VTTSKRPFFLLVAGIILILGAASLAWFSGVEAAPARQEPPTPVPTPSQAAPSIVVPNLSLSDEYCLSCHGVPGDTLTLPNGDILDLFVSVEMHQASVHGELGYACVQCHTEVGEYPHPPFSAVNRRDVTLQLTETCGRCHATQAVMENDSVHTLARSAGYLQAAVCVDCHTAHETRRLSNAETKELLPDTRAWIPERCAMCHNAIYQKYSQSVHGAALSEGNPDIPTCIDCHGVHNIENPQSTYFRLRSPQNCAKCHTDEKIMSQYGLSTAVLDTYVTDFHGTTIAIFEKTAPDARVNTPVCYDCHGIHDISRVDDPQTGLQMKQNLLGRCQVCHPDANANFPAAWMSHYIPSPDNYSIVYYVNLFYKYFIPLTLGGMAALVVMDAGRLLLNRTRRRRPAHPASEEMAEFDSRDSQNIAELPAPPETLAQAEAAAGETGSGDAEMEQPAAEPAVQEMDVDATVDEGQAAELRETEEFLEDPPEETNTGGADLAGEAPNNEAEHE
jgi:hypothetical protein